MKKQILPWGCLVLSLALNAWLFYDYFVLKIHLSLAHDQVISFEQCSQDITLLDENDKKELKEHVQNYYPSGTKQVAGSKLDNMVETVRRLVLEDMEQVISKQKRIAHE